MEVKIHTDKVVPIYKPKGKPITISYKITESYPDAPSQTMTDLRRMVMTGDTMTTLKEIDIPGVGVVKDIPFIQLSPKAIMLIGDTWLAILDT